jgi:hypothetical protein
MSRWQISYNGLLMGPGTPYRITRVTGIRGLPAMSQASTQKYNADGYFPGYQFQDERAIAIDITVGRYTGTTIEQNLQALANAIVPVFDPDDMLPLNYNILADTSDSEGSSDTGSGTVTCRPVGPTSFPIDTAAAGLGYYPLTLQFLASSPIVNYGEGDL